MIAYLGHYDPPFARAANDSWWQVLRSHAVALGLAAPPALERSRDYGAIWTDPGLAFAQTCGLPLVTTLAGQVRLIAAPVYGFAGCDGPHYRSVIVVRDDAAYAGLADLAGARAAINSPDSHSGHTALYHTIAPLAGGRRFFGAQVMTGAHVNSLKAVRAGDADVCACDCITYGMIARGRPEWLAGLRVLAQSEAAPVPPYITHGSAPVEDVASWREAMRLAFADVQGDAARAVLGLQDFAVPTLDTYRRIGEMAAIAATAT